MLKLHNLYKVYRTDEIETVALNGVSLEIAQGDFVAVMGPSGCGKSTLLNIVGLLDNPSDGDYFFFDENVVDDTRRRSAARFARRTSASSSRASISSTSFPSPRTSSSRSCTTTCRPTNAGAGWLP